MNRKQFLFSLPLIGGVAKAIAAKKEKFVGEPVFNKKLLQDRIDHLRKYPATIDECWKPTSFKEGDYFCSIDPSTGYTYFGRFVWKDGPGSEILFEKL